MLSIFAMMVIPGNIDTAQNELVLYGMANIVKYDAVGNEVFQQTIHNQLTNQGEQYILGAVFQNGTSAEANITSFGAICVSDAAQPSASDSELHTAFLFDAGNAHNTGTLTCEKDEGTSINTDSGVATIGPFTFAAGSDNVEDDDQINSIGICQVDDAVSNGAIGFVDCQLGGDASDGALLAVIGVTATTLGTGETVDITYTFDISSSTT